MSYGRYLLKIESLRVNSRSLLLSQQCLFFTFFEVVVGLCCFVRLFRIQCIGHIVVISGIRFGRVGIHNLLLFFVDVGVFLFLKRHFVIVGISFEDFNHNIIITINTIVTLVAKHISQLINVIFINYFSKINYYFKHFFIYPQSTNLLFYSTHSSNKMAHVTSYSNYLFKLYDYTITN